MQKCSAAYKEQMRKPLRNEAFVRVMYGVFSVSATQQAEISNNGHTSYGNGNLNDDILPDLDYATFEKDYWKVDGTQLIPPVAAPYSYDGFVSSEVSGGDNEFANNPIITVVFSDPQDLYGLTFAFPEGQIPQQVRVNGTDYFPNSEHYIMSDWLENITQITIEFVKAPAAGRRVRLNRLQFGQSILFDNRKIVKTGFSSSIDFLSLSLTQKKFTFTVDNRDQFYNPLNAQGVYRFLESKQPIEVEYGYELDNGKIEWIPGSKTVSSGAPTSAETQVSFTGVDDLSNLTGVFYKGLYRPAGISLYDLAEEVLQDAGVKHYVIDIHLKSVFTKAALPIITHRECLQIIANAGQCILFTDRRGYIKLEIALDPIVTIGDNGHVAFSNSNSAYNDQDLPVAKYADFLPNSWKAAGKKVIMPGSPPYERVGFVSDKICGSDGTFSEYPVFFWKYSFPYSIYQIPITFDNVDGEYATDFDVVYKLSGTEIDRVSVTGNNAVRYTVENEISGIDEINIEIHKWNTGTRRATIAQIGSGRVNDMRIDFNSVSSLPSIAKSAQVKSVTVKSYSHSVDTADTELFKDDIVLNGTVTLNITHEAATDLNVSISVGTIDEQTHYTRYSVIVVSGTGAANLILTGKKITSSSVNVVKQINPQGEEKQALENPIITDLTNAQNTAIWIADYFGKRNFLNAPYRGNPEVDGYDLLYMESQFEGLFPVRIIEHKLDFNGGFSGSVKAVKMNG